MTALHAQGVQQSKGSLEVWRAGPEGEHILTALAPGRGRGFKKEYITPAQLQPFVLKLLKMTTYTFVDGTLEVLEVQDTPEAWRVYVKAEGLQAPGAPSPAKSTSRLTSQYTLQAMSLTIYQPGRHLSTEFRRVIGTIVHASWASSCSSFRKPDYISSRLGFISSGSSLSQALGKFRSKDAHCQ